MYQLERCPETYRYHWQGYVLFARKQTLAACKTRHPTAHWEPRRGTHEQARDYCKKEDTRVSGDDPENVHDPGPFEFGDEPRPGERQDLIAVRAAIDAGDTLQQIWSEHFPAMVRYNRSLLLYRQLTTPKRDFWTQTIVFYGPTGTGKTRFIYEHVPQDKCFWLNASRTKGDPWVDGYDPLQHEHVVLDDFYGWIRWSTILRLLDWYPTQMEGKGYKIEWRPHYVWITSNQPPEEWYNLSIQGRAWETLARRLHTIIRFTPEGEHITLKDEAAYQEEHFL